MREYAVDLSETIGWVQGRRQNIPSRGTAEGNFSSRETDQANMSALGHKITSKTTISKGNVQNMQQNANMMKWNQMHMHALNIDIFK